MTKLDDKFPRAKAKMLCKPYPIELMHSKFATTNITHNIEIIAQVSVDDETWDSVVNDPCDFDIGQFYDSGSGHFRLSAPNRATLIIDTQVYGYARYIGYEITD